MTTKQRISTHTDWMGSSRPTRPLSLGPAVRISDPDVSSEIISAADDGDLYTCQLRVYVTEPVYQKSVMYFAADRIVAQMFVGSDARELQIQIGEPMVARDVPGVAFGLGVPNIGR